MSYFYFYTANRILIQTLCVLLLLFIHQTTTVAQQLPIIGMFQYSRLLYNPAAAGAHEGINASVLNRSQWTGLKGAPSTQVLSVDAPLKNHVGTGLVFMADKISVLKQYNILGNISYRIPINHESYIQAGLRAGATLVYNNYDQLFQWDANDPAVENRTSSGVIPRIGAGVFYKNPHGYIGFSAPDLVSIDQKKLFYNTQSNTSTLHRNYMVTSGARIHLSEYLTFEPNVLVQYYPTRPVFAYANAGIGFNQTVTAGIGYTSSKALSLYGIVNLSTRIKVGYRYEYGPSNFQVGKFSSNELLLSYGIN